MKIFKSFSRSHIVIVCVVSFLSFFFCACQGKSQEQISLSSLEPKESLLETPSNATVNVIEDSTNSDTLGIESYQGLSSEELVRLAWEASSKNDLSKVDELVAQCLELYGNEAKLLHDQLKDFPVRGEEKNYQALNDVATCLFVRGEILMNQGKKEEAIEQFQDILDHYKWAQSWDPRGWYWSVAEKSQDSIDVLTGKAEEELQHVPTKAIGTTIHLNSPGKDNIIDYTKYGKFLNIGTVDYHYSITDPEGLTAASGEGIYPDTKLVYSDPQYKAIKNTPRFQGSHWDFVNSDDLEAAFYKWATASESWGVKLFYIGLIFEKAKMYNEAIKAYHALVVHFPKTVGWTYWQTPWYPGQAAIAKIRHIIRSHPELNLNDMWMKIEVHNGFDNDDKNDIIVTYPGKIIEKGLLDKVKDTFHLEKDMILSKITKKVGDGDVRLVQYDNGHWQLLVKDQPYVIKGITYSPTKIGQSADKGTLKNWMEEDENNNGLPDGPYDSWVDQNRNNVRDADEPIVGDFELMKQMGVNTLRIYHHPFKPNKELLRKMYDRFGFRVIMGDFVGKYTHGSGATWLEGADYDNPEHRKNMLESVKQMVMEYKDEPYVLVWLLGNENNYGVGCNADKKPESYFKFIDEVAQWIKSVDKNHPVAIGNGDTLYLDIFAKYAPHVDIFAANVYRGDYGFGSFWEQVFDASGKPAFITEYGCPAFAQHLTLDEGEDAQAEYQRGNWLDIEENTAGHSRGVGNALGGVVFEWMDEWWKGYEPFRHDWKSTAIGPFPGGYYHEEWFGLIGQGNGTQSPFLRHLRKSYYLYKELWN